MSVIQSVINKKINKFFLNKNLDKLIKDINKLANKTLDLDDEVQQFEYDVNDFKNDKDCAGMYYNHKSKKPHNKVFEIVRQLNAIEGISARVGPTYTRGTFPNDNTYYQTCIDISFDDVYSDSEEENDGLVG